MRSRLYSVLGSKSVSVLSVVVTVPLLALLSAITDAGPLPGFTELIEKHAPAVVKIEAITRAKSSARSSLPQLPENVPEIFRQFFDHQRKQVPQRNGRSMGSGFFISSDGYLLTNNHVVEDAADIVVRLTDRREFDAEVVGLDPQSDLALLKVDAKKLPYLRFANSDKAKVGEWVLAIGSPFGLDYSVSAGIISAIGRSLPSSSQQNYVPFIQTDVAINPGNSGGPLFNLEGEVVGINSQIYTNSGGSIGLSFAIPASLARNVVEQLKESGTVDRGWLGVVIQDVDKDLALSFGLKKPQGALISQLDQEGPGAKSGLKVSDIILAFNNRKIKTSSDLPHIVGPIKPGTTVPATVMRKGEKVKLEVTIGSRTHPQGVSRGSGNSKETRLGVAVQAITQEIRDAIGSGGVVIVDVAEDSPAAKAGLQKGDVIVQLGFDEVDDLDSYADLESALSANKPQPVRVVRKGVTIFRSVIIKE